MPNAVAILFDADRVVADYAEILLIFSEAPNSPAFSWMHLMFLKALCLFLITALAEIIGCYLPYLWLKKSGSIWLLIPAAASLALFVWLLTLHPVASGRVYAAYGGVYVAVALLWLWKIDRVPLTTWDLVGAAVSIAGMSIIVIGGWRS